MDVLSSSAPPGPWQHSPPDERARRELAALNDRFLEVIRLLALAPAHAADNAEQDAHILGLDLTLAERVAHLPMARRRELAACPYALVGVGLGDLEFWRQTAGPHGRPATYRRAPGGGSFSPAHAAALRDALFLTLAYAWHLAQTAPVSARWMLGACPEALTLLRQLPFSSLGRIADECPGLLRARLADHRRFWNDLVSAVASGAQQSRFAAVSLGLQLSAAAGAPRNREGTS
ncbi:MAG: hypothetical protein AAF184_12330 [Pseudomonadota bacterium]